jgi:hypothetical protein
MLVSPGPPLWTSTPLLHWGPLAYTLLHWGPLAYTLLLHSCLQPFTICCLLCIYNIQLHINAFEYDGKVNLFQ